MGRRNPRSAPGAHQGPPRAPYPEGTRPGGRASAPSSPERCDVRRALPRPHPNAIDATAARKPSTRHAIDDKD